MGVGLSIDISDEQHKTILSLLERHLPGTEAWVYGSRAKWTSRPQSDLDLVVFAKPRQRLQVGNLREAFEDSNLPFRVDLFVWDEVPETFRRQIEAEHVEFVPALIDAKNEKMTEEWPEVVLEELLTEPVRNGIYKKKEFHGRGTKIVNMGELFSYPRLSSVPMKRLELSKSEADRFLLKAGDLLFARRSLVAEGAGKCCVVLSVDEPTTFESSIIRARPDITRADSLYLYYFFNSPLGLYRLGTIRRQVAVAGITGTDLSKLFVPLPSILQQRTIAHILGTLDDKIELNRRMNETLEAMARALFKSWFVDFDPVRAKMEGRDPGLPQHILDLFPDQFDDRGIPIGWRRASLREVIVTLETGKRPRGGVSGTSEGIPSVGAESIKKVGDFDFSKTKFVSNEFYSKMNKGHVSDGDVLVYKDGGKPGELRPSVTYVSRGFPFEKFCINEHVFRVRTDAFSQQFLYCLLSTDDAIWQMRELATGVAQPGLNQMAMKSIAFVIPDNPNLIRFAESMIDPLIDGCNESARQSSALATARDTLLPKLISGDIRIHDTEQFIGEIA